MRATILVLGLGLLAGGAEGQEKKPGKLSDEDAKRVAALIGQLDSKKYPEREKAMKELAGFGERALGLLEKAAKGPASLEVQRRLNVVIWKLRAPAREEEGRRIAALIEQLSSVRFADRQNATMELQAIGRPALQHLYAATLSPDAEIVRRADVIIAHILKDPR